MLLYFIQYSSNVITHKFYTMLSSYLSEFSMNISVQMLVSHCLDSVFITIMDEDKPLSKIY